MYINKIMLQQVDWSTDNYRRIYLYVRAQTNITFTDSSLIVLFL